jgi:hypothetical protein
MIVAASSKSPAERKAGQLASSPPTSLSSPVFPPSFIRFKILGMRVQLRCFSLSNLHTAEFEVRGMIQEERKQSSSSMHTIINVAMGAL